MIPNRSKDYEKWAPYAFLLASILMLIAHYLERRFTLLTVFYIFMSLFSIGTIIYVRQKNK